MEPPKIISKKSNIKTIFYGNTTVGKSTIILLLKDGTFYAELPCTVGVSFVKLHHNQKTYDMWDTAGQERFYSLAPMYFRGASIEVFVFDVTNLDTINTLKIYERYAIYRTGKIIVVGNKIDLLQDINNLLEIDKKVKEQIELLGFSDKICSYVYMSAKTGEGRKELLKVLDIFADTIEEEPFQKNVSFPELESIIKEDKDKCC